MAVGYATLLRNAKLDALTTFAAGGAKLRIYDGVRPATGAAITTQVKLAEFTGGTPFAPAAAAGVLAPTLPANVSGLATGTATWWRVTKADGTTFVADGGINDGMTLSSTAITTAVTLSVTSWSITAGNA